MNEYTANNWERTKREAAARGDVWTESKFDTIDGAGGFVDRVPPAAVERRDPTQPANYRPLNQRRAEWLGSNR